MSGSCFTVGHIIVAHSGCDEACLGLCTGLASTSTCYAYIGGVAVMIEAVAMAVAEVGVATARMPGAADTARLPLRMRRLEGMAARRPQGQPVAPHRPRSCAKATGSAQAAPTPTSPSGAASHAAPAMLLESACMALCTVPLSPKVAPRMCRRAVKCVTYCRWVIVGLSGNELIRVAGLASLIRELNCQQSAQEVRGIGWRRGKCNRCGTGKPGGGGGRRARWRA